MPSISSEKIYPPHLTRPFSDPPDRTAVEAEPDFPDDDTYPERDFVADLEMAEAQIEHLKMEVLSLRRDLQTTRATLVEAQENLVFMTGKASDYLNDLSVVLSQMTVMRAADVYGGEEVNAY
jgi:hypothetical protein